MIADAWSSSLMLQMIDNQLCVGKKKRNLNLGIRHTRYFLTQFCDKKKF
jgi:hypothetical protein